MKRYGALFGCIGVVALIGPAARPAEKGGVTDTALACEAQTARTVPDLARGVPEKASCVAGVRGKATGHEVAVLSVCPEACTYIVVDGLPRMLHVVPQARRFHPYPECEIVGMPFAGVKMCE
jgi:hypothetical protein